MQIKPEALNQRTLTFPDYEMRETLSDLSFIEDHLLAFRTVVYDHFLLYGSGAVIVDTNGNTSAPFRSAWYLPHDQLETLDEPIVKSMVNSYDPSSEIVIVLLKAEDRQRVYRVALPAEFPGVH